MANDKYFNNSKNHQWAAKMIPVLIRWAQTSWNKPHYYSDLSKAVGHKTDQIGSVMGDIKIILDHLSKDNNNKFIPTLNALVSSKGNGLPSDGFDFVVKNYSTLSEPSKKGEVEKINKTAHDYDWSWVLKALDLKPVPIFTKGQISSVKSFAKQNGIGGGEGVEHKKIKEYIKSHPELMGFAKYSSAENEHILPSGDRLDVYILMKNDDRVAIEVKPSTSPDEDVTRGIFQCVKYLAVMEAERVMDDLNPKHKNHALLVLGGTMSEQNRQLANDLSIPYIEKFKI